MDNEEDASKKRTPRNRKSHSKRRKAPTGWEDSQRCPSCGLMGPPETFRDAKCLGCQVSEFLGSL